MDDEIVIDIIHKPVRFYASDGMLFCISLARPEDINLTERYILLVHFDRLPQNKWYIMNIFYNAIDVDKFLEMIEAKIITKEQLQIYMLYE